MYTWKKICYTIHTPSGINKNRYTPWHLAFSHILSAHFGLLCEGLVEFMFLKAQPLGFRILTDAMPCTSGWLYLRKSTCAKMCQLSIHSETAQFQLVGGIPTPLKNMNVN